MKHGVRHKKLNRTTSHRLAMLRNMVTSVLQHERITTTVPKAKAARPLVERVITLGKKGGVANVRLAAKTVRDRQVLEKVFGPLKERFASRAGGYTRIVRAGSRRGDATQMAILELVDRVAPVKQVDAAGDANVEKAAK